MYVKVSMYVVVRYTCMGKVYNVCVCVLSIWYIKTNAANTLKYFIDKLLYVS